MEGQHAEAERKRKIPLVPGEVSLSNVYNSNDIAFLSCLKSGGLTLT